MTGHSTGRRYSPHAGCLAVCRAALLVMILSVMGCGFHLRGSAGGSAELPPVSVQASDPAVSTLMRQWLYQSGNAPVADMEAVWLIRIYPERRVRRIMSVDSAGNVQEYELYYQLRFEVHAADGHAVLAAQTVSVTRQYAYQATAVLAKANEEAALWSDMQQEAVRRIGFRLQRLPGQMPGGEE